MRKVLMFILLMASSMGSYSQGIEFMKNPKWADVINRAEKEDKMIFLDCYTTWCGPCKALDKKTFPNKEVGEFFNDKFICVKLDMEKGDGIEINKKYKAYIPGYPSLLFITKKGEVLHQIVGFKEPSVLIEAAEAGLSGKTIPVMKKRYEQGENSIEFIKEYLEVLNYAFLRDDMKKVALNYISSLPINKLKEKDVLELYLPYINDITTKEVEYIINNMIYYIYSIKEFDRYELISKLNTAMNSEVTSIFEIKKDSLDNTITLEANEDRIKHVKKLFKKHVFASKEKYLAKLNIHHLLVNEEWEDAIHTLLVANEIEVLGSSPTYISNVSKYILERYRNKKDLNKLLVMLQNKIQYYTNKDITSSYNVYDTMSDLALSTGQKDKAAEYKNIYETEYKKVQEKFKKYFK